jgi:hypothetical protein
MGGGRARRPDVRRCGLDRASKQYEVAKAEHDAVEREKAEAAKPRVPAGFLRRACGRRAHRGHSQFISVAICELCFAQCVTTIANAKAKRAAGITDVDAPVERP